jgi:hypothetical protein
MRHSTTRHSNGSRGNDYQQQLTSVAVKQEGFTCNNAGSPTAAGWQAYIRVLGLHALTTKSVVCALHMTKALVPATHSKIRRHMLSCMTRFCTCAPQAPVTHPGKR